MINTNPAIWVSHSGHAALNFGARTTVELNFLDPLTLWWDISLVKGFNVGAKIKVMNVDGSEGSIHPETICTSVNCEDAYWICDTSWNNLFHPVYSSYQNEAAIEVTFCPQNVTDTIPLNPYPRQRNVTGDAPFYCACSAGVPSLDDLFPVARTVLLAEDVCGPITLD
jgi:hypothetical protein